MSLEIRHPFVTVSYGMKGYYAAVYDDGGCILSDEFGYDNREDAILVAKDMSYQFMIPLKV